MKIPPTDQKSIGEPTVEEFAREFPLMSVVKRRIEIERALRDYAATKGFVMSADLQAPVAYDSLPTVIDVDVLDANVLLPTVTKPSKHLDLGRIGS